MSDDPNVPIQPEPAEQPAAEPAAAPDAAPAGPSAGEAWETVVVKLRELGDAVAAWTKAATDTPENRQHLDEVRSGVADMTRQASDAFSSVASSDFGRHMSENATQMGQAIGSTAHEVGQTAGPAVASAFAGLADMFGRAAHKVDQTVAAQAAHAPQPAAPAEPAEPAPAPATAEPAAPAPAPAPAAPEPPVAPTPPEGPASE
jgi:2-oxoglutarate dehydrogenase E2 component (dihydrolipoamide succinyltransferase)